MSLYIDFSVACPVDETVDPPRTITTAWSKQDTVLAVSTDDNHIRFYNEEGEILEDASLEKSNSNALVMDWRSRSRVLAAGWEDGTITLWNVKDKVEKDDSSVHSSRITFCQWSPEGGRLLTADANGIVAVWRTDHRGRLTPVSKRDIGNGESILKCCWFLCPEYREAQRELPTPPQKIFVATQMGSIYLIDLKGEILAAAKVDGGKIRTLNWFDEKQKLIVITEDCYMSQLTYENGDAQLKVVNKVKLSLTSGGSRGGVQKAIWTSPGLLATVATESSVRFWDIANDQSYFIRYSNSAGIIQLDADGNGTPEQGGDPTDCISDICFNARTRVLAASTENGKIFLWRFVGESAPPLAASTKPDKENLDVQVFQQSQNSPRYPQSGVESWESMATLSSTSVPTSGIDWGPRESSLCVLMPEKCSIMNETILHRTLRCDVAALQVSAQRLLVQRGASIRMETHVGLRIKGVDVSDSHALVWNQKKAEIYEFQDETMEKVASFPSKTESMALFGDTVFQTSGSKLEVCNLQGVSRKEITFSEHEGEPRLLHINGKFLAVATSRGLLKVFDVSRREPRQVGTATRFVEKHRTKSGKSEKLIPIGEIRSIRCNADGTRVSILSDIVRGQSMCEPDTRIHVWNLDKDEFQAFNFGPTRYPISHFWDGQEPKLLACEAKRIGKHVSAFDDKAKKADKLRASRLRHVSDDDVLEDKKKEPTEDEIEKERLQKIRNSRRKKRNADVAEIEVVTLFATDERVGVMMQDSFSLDPGLDALIGIKVPRLFFISKPVDGLPRLKGRTMRDFIGLNNRVDEETKRALIDFSYYLTIGNLDEAYRAVKLIENVSVWENMAHMCVKTRRLDVAVMCLSNMGHARGAQALRESEKEPEIEAQIAMVAIQLGLLDEAERLYADAGRYDLLNRMLRASGQWTKALEVANSFDRIHLRETHFEYGRYLESMGDFQAAIANYEASGTHRKQVPRMLFESDRIEELEAYIQSQCDEELTKWWGQYCESLGEYDRAIHVYQRAGDELSLVRLYCFMDNLQAAAEIALNSSNGAASYHLARQYEQRQDTGEAIQFYSRAGRYNHAVRLAKENGLDTEIVNLALRASKNTMVEAARYLESKGLYEDAVVLYQKGGNVPRALDLCFRVELFDLLTNIADSLSIRPKPSSNNQDGKKNHNGASVADVEQTREEYGDSTTESSPEILARCAEFFIKHNLYDKAVHLYITSGDYETALELCFNQKVIITEEMAESMTLEKMSVTPAAKKSTKTMSKIKSHNERRQQLLENIAKCCKKQQSFHLATKKYTQAGDRLKAMKCLLRSGDTEKIIFFAGVSRSREIYILAANYLQNLDWRNDPEIMKAIINYYTKAKAFQQLSGFYDACAQMEIDEYRDYDKALGAFKEAVKYMGKVQDESMKDELLMSLQQRISLVERFVHAGKLVLSDPDEAERICNSLLVHPEVESAIRVGDIFALLVGYHHKNRNMEEAHQLIEKMRARGVSLSQYLDRDMVDSIAHSVGVESFFEDDFSRKDGLDEDEIEEDLSWGHK